MVQYNLENILPHKPPMILIDDITEINLDEGRLNAIVKITPQKRFYEPKNNGVNSLAGLEFMAQTIGCYAFFKSQTEKPIMGLLLGARLFNNKIDYYKNGEEYTIKVHEVFTDNEIVVFDCLIYDKNNDEIASATINAYQSEKVKELIKVGK